MAGAVQHALGHQRGAVGHGDVPEAVAHLDAVDVGAEVRVNAEAARELLAQRIADVVVELGEQAIEGIDDRHLHAERGEGARTRSRSRRRR